MMSKVAVALLLMQLIDWAMAQANCTNLTSLSTSQFAETSGLGSWDVCCARDGSGCVRNEIDLLSSCDAAHPTRLVCNKVPQGTMCMMGRDGLVDGSPCGSSQILSCGDSIVLGGSNFSLDLLVTLPSVGTILANGLYGSQLCCSDASCTSIGALSTCPSPYNLTCVT